MVLRRTALACVALVLLLTCSSCRLEGLDANGDGIVSKSELVVAVLGSVCDDEADGDEEVPDEEPSGDDTADGETPADETPSDQTDN